MRLKTFLYLCCCLNEHQKCKLTISFPSSQIPRDIYQSLSSLLHSYLGKLISIKIKGVCSAALL